MLDNPAVGSAGSADAAVGIPASTTQAANDASVTRVNRFNSFLAC
ncbi:hypothetical protein [Rhodococcus qingshengii]|nr:hypothetical protein [Rhodococcus qingshengii]